MWGRSRTPQATPRRVHENLVAAFRDADYARTTAHVPLGTIAAERYVVEARLADGAHARGVLPESSADPPFAWVVGNRVEVWLDVVHPAPRELQLRIAGAVDQPQTLVVHWGGHELGRAILPPDGSEPRLAFDVPVEWQRVGRNQVSLGFARTVTRRLVADRPAVPVAARLRHVRLLSRDGEGPSRPFAPGPVTVETGSGRVRVVRLPPACLASLTFQVPDAKGVLLRWTVRMAEVPFDAWLEDEQGRRVSLPGGRRTGTPVVIEHDLGPWRGQPLRLWLRTDAGREGRVEIGPLLVMAVPAESPSPRDAGADGEPVLGALAAVAPAAGLGTPPSFLVVVLDGLRRDHVSGLGHAGWTTPNLDGLIGAGTAPGMAVTPSTSSRAALAGLLTGMGPGALGALGRAGDPVPVPDLGAGAPSLAATLADAGWRTALFLGRPGQVQNGLRRGFAEVVPEPGLATDPVDGNRLADDFDAWLGTLGEAPFLAVIALAEPDPPFDVSAEASRAFVAPYDGPVTADLAWATAFHRGELALAAADVRHLRELYEARVAGSDAVLGRLLVSLGWAGREPDTVVVVTSTHGLSLLEHGRAGSAVELSREAMEIPLVVRGLDAVAHPPSGVATLADVAPTLLGMAGLPVPAGMDGRDLVADPPVGRGVLSRGVGERPTVAWTVDRWRFVFDSETGARSLHDLTSDDPARDRSAEHPVRAALLEQHLQTALVDSVGSDPVEAALRRRRRRP